MHLPYLHILRQLVMDRYSHIGVVTFIALWPILVILQWTGTKKFNFPADSRIQASISGIALGGVALNSGYMVRCVGTYSMNAKLSYHLV